jgi:hypothetical protein
MFSRGQIHTPSARAAETEAPDRQPIIYPQVTFSVSDNLALAVPLVAPQPFK